MCLELFEDGAGPAVRKIWLDDVELPELRDTRADPPPPKYDRLSIGVMEFHATPVMTDVWIDDIRISSARIGCATP